jgi:hypothetical protein
MRPTSSTRAVLAVLAVLAVPACSRDNEDSGDISDAGDSDSDTDSDSDADSDGWPEANEWSWNGSWTPGDGDFPLDGLLDDEYFDGHLGGDGAPTPILPPGAWDWSDADDDLANWRNFEDNIGGFSMLLDSEGRHFGWELAPNDPGACDYSGPADYFEGSSGPDLLRLGAAGAAHSFASGELGDGPDLLVFERSWSLDLRVGSSETGALRDDDLVVAGCGADPDGAFDVETTSVHTGPGADWVFVRDISRAAADLGNGADGRTDTLDPDDGGDLVVLRGNTQDFRVMGGAGDDVAVWFVDDNVQTTTWLGPNFFGGGGAGDALWGDGGTDLLVLAIPADTALVTATPTPAGGLLVMGTDGTFIPDEPTVADPFAAYCVECGESPEGRRTVIMEYDSADGAIATGYFYVTAFERLQVGVGEGARVFAIDDVAGAIAELPDEPPFAPPAWPTWECE